MAKTPPPPELPENRLLARLPVEEYQQLRPHLQPVSLDLKRVLYEPGAPIDCAYFPSNGVLSQLTMMEDGAGIELATVGHEGMVGLPILWGIAESSSRVVVQVPSNSLRLSADRLSAAIGRDGALRRLLLLYNGVFMFQVSQAVACNGLHSVQQRCCRWMLMTCDRVTAEEFPMTHEFLAHMLGVRRSSVTQVLWPLQQAGLVRYRRGRMVVLDRDGLEEASCECYRIVKREFDRLLP
jgi:CRP-like cAMP-binding protein